MSWAPKFSLGEHCIDIVVTGHSVPPTVPRNSLSLNSDLYLLLDFFTLSRKYRSQRPKQILIHLCFALLGLYLSFLIGIGRSNLRYGCVVFGGLIHFFCLASMAWMCVEAVNMYLLFVKIFDSGISGFMWKAILAAWGMHATDSFPYNTITNEISCCIGLIARGSIMYLKDKQVLMGCITSISLLYVQMCFTNYHWS